MKDVVVGSAREVGDDHAVLNALLQIDVLVERDIGPEVDELDPLVGRPKVDGRVYGITGDRIDELIEHAQGSKERGWWQRYPTNRAAPRLRNAPGPGETAAKAVSCFGADPIPELLAHRRVLHRPVRRGAARPHRGGPQRRLTVTTTRQQRLLGAEPLELWAVLDEAALRRSASAGRS
ncbi:Scr1 family TA system antitoxin-like transcriptional regulator [Saccharopolyspora gregorii]|uniref:DUF5753 domain-containing protein n=1 Tax=Saccharopolyspora gregorii TaxID=33914 RepID=A0ABP6S344_9PSEU